MKSKKILTQSVLVILGALYFQASQACDQVAADESENLLSITKQVGSSGFDTESYYFKIEDCQHHTNLKSEHQASASVSQESMLTSSHQFVQALKR